MEKERLEEIKRNSNSAFKYIKNVEKEYLKGKTIIDQEIFINKFKENHSLEVVIFLCNELNEYKENSILFSKRLFRIIIPLYVVLFTLLGVITGPIINFVGNLTKKIIDIEIENNNMEFDNAIDLINQVSSNFLHYFLILFIIVLVSLLLLHWISHKIYSKRMQYLSWLNSVKELKENKMIRD